MGIVFQKIFSFSYKRINYDSVSCLIFSFRNWLDTKCMLVSFRIFARAVSAVITFHNK